MVIIKMYACVLVMLFGVKQTKLLNEKDREQTRWNQLSLSEEDF